MDKTMALLCAKISHSAYGKGFDMPGFKLHGRFENAGTNTQGIFGVANDKTLILAFRGSEETGVADWITDLKFIPAVFPYGDPKKTTLVVHSGFLEAYRSVREAMFKVAKDSPIKPIICTGHSLGAALATLCAIDIQYNLSDKQVSAYTFGSPRVGNADFAKFYSQHISQTFRFVNAVDIVPTLPPSIPLLVDYEHVGQLCQIGNLEESQLSADAGLSHLPANYIQSLTA